MVAHPVHPAGQTDGLADIGRCEGATGMAAIAVHGRSLKIVLQVARRAGNARFRPPEKRTRRDGCQGPAPPRRPVNAKSALPSAIGNAAAPERTAGRGTDRSRSALSSAILSPWGLHRRGTMSEKNLSELFHDTLKDVYYAEKKILSSLPKMAKAAQDYRRSRPRSRSTKPRPKGRSIASRRSSRTSAQTPRGKKCDAIEGILDEGKEIMQEYKGSAALDAGLLAAAQAVEHYEISRYGTLKAWAEKLGLKQVGPPARPDAAGGEEDRRRSEQDRHELRQRRGGVRNFRPASRLTMHLARSSPAPAIQAGPRDLQRRALGILARALFIRRFYMDWNQSRRKLEAGQGQGQGEVGQAH